MPYHYIEDVATADVAFEATGKTREEMFIASWDATLNVMLEDLETVQSNVEKNFHLEEESAELLLFQFLQEQIFYKDSEELLLRVSALKISAAGKGFSLDAQVYGEKLNPEFHPMNVDVKAVTFHMFKVEETPEGHKAFVVLDI